MSDTKNAIQLRFRKGDEEAAGEQNRVGNKGQCSGGEEVMESWISILNRINWIFIQQKKSQRAAEVTRWWLEFNLFTVHFHLMKNKTTTKKKKRNYRAFILFLPPPRDGQQRTGDAETGRKAHLVTFIQFQLNCSLFPLVFVNSSSPEPLYSTNNTTCWRFLRWWWTWLKEKLDNKIELISQRFSSSLFLVHFHPIYRCVDLIRSLIIFIATVLSLLFLVLSL